MRKYLALLVLVLSGVTAPSAAARFAPPLRDHLLASAPHANRCEQSFAAFTVALARCAIRAYGSSDGPLAVRVRHCRRESATAVTCSLYEIGEPLVDPLNLAIVRRNVLWRVSAQLIRRHGRPYVYLHLAGSRDYPMRIALWSPAPAPLRITPLALS